MPDDADYLVPLEQIRARYGQASMHGERLREIERGRTVFELPITKEVGGGVGDSVHGGILATLADIGVVSAVLSTCRAGEAMRGTCELNISYLRPAVGEMVVVDSRVIKKGRSLAVGDVDLTNEDGALIAKARVTYAIAQVGRPAG